MSTRNITQIASTGRVERSIRALRRAAALAILGAAAIALGGCFYMGGHGGWGGCDGHGGGGHWGHGGGHSH